MSWHSFHIHYYASQDLLLVENIGPVVTSFRKEGINGWFFLRYWKHGPHIRLRLRLDDKDKEVQNKTLRLVQSQVGNYLIQHPSTVVLPESIQDSLRMLSRLEDEDEKGQEILPDNTVQPEQYNPEYNRYGGESGIAVAESLFEVSSNLALDVLGVVSKAPARRLAISFCMLLAGLRGAGLTEHRIASFLASYCRFWSRYLPGNISASWFPGLDQQEQTLSPHAAAILSGSSLPASLVGDALVRWTSAVAAATATVDANAGDILPHVIMPEPDAPMERRRDFLLLNYLHTHNNRLGIVPGHEAYLAFLAHHIVCRLAGLTPQLQRDAGNNASEPAMNYVST